MDNTESYTYKTYKKNNKIIKKGWLLALICGVFVEFIVFLYFYKTLVLPINMFLLIILSFIGIKYLYKKEIKPEIKKNYHTWGKGAGAEWKVGNHLEKVLGIEFKVIHDFPNSKGNIDHIVIGPTGVYTIETKSYSGIIKYNKNFLYANDRDITKDLRQAYAEAEHINNLTNGEIKPTPILAFAYAKIDKNTIKGKINNVLVCQLNFIKKAIEYKYNNNKLSAEEINDYYETLVHIKERNNL